MGGLVLKALWGGDVDVGVGVSTGIGVLGVGWETCI